MGGIAQGGGDGGEGSNIAGAAGAGMGLGAGMGIGAGMAQIIAQGMRGDQPASGGTTTQPTPAQPGATPTSAAATMTCYNCQAQIPANSKFCPECGASQATKTCSNCGTQNLPNAKFCINCGTKLE